MTRRPAGAAQAVVGLTIVLAMVMAVPAAAARPVVTIVSAADGAREAEARQATPRPRAHVSEQWTVRARVRADEPKSPGEVPSFVRSVTVRVLADGDRARDYADGSPIGANEFPCPDNPSSEVSPTVEVAVPWDTTLSLNGPYRIVVEARSCRPEEPPGVAEVGPVFVDNRPEPAFAVEVAVTAGAVRLVWQAARSDDAAGFWVERAEEGSDRFRMVGSTRGLTFDDRPPAGRHVYRIVALRMPAEGDRPIPGEPSDPSAVVDTTTPGAAAGDAPPGALELPPVDISPAQSEPIRPLPVDEGTYEAQLPVAAGDDPVVAEGPLEWGVGDPEATESVQSVAVRRRRSAVEVVRGGLGALGFGVVLLVAASHVAAWLARTRSDQLTALGETR